MGTYFITALPFYPLLLVFPYFTKKYLLAPLLRLYSFLIIKAFNIKIQTQQLPKIKNGSIIVSNHLGYLDLFIISSFYKGSFVSTMEIKELPFIGILTTLAGCIFIERRSRENLRHEISIVREHLKNKINVIFFPEAKSTDGTSVLAFKKAFFRPAIEEKSNILALCINYVSVDGETLNANNKKNVLWYRQLESIIAHIVVLSRTKAINVKISADHLSYEKYSKNPLHPAQITHNLISSNYTPIP